MDKNKFIEDYTTTLTQMRKALQVSVKIDHEEVIKIVVRDLIDKRNSPTNDIKAEFDKVLRYYIDAEEFEKYVVRGEKIE